jgi:hypothetical protein
MSCRHLGVGIVDVLVLADHAAQRPPDGARARPSSAGSFSISDGSTGERGG